MLKFIKIDIEVRDLCPDALCKEKSASDKLSCFFFEIF